MSGKKKPKAYKETVLGKVRTLLFDDLDGSAFQIRCHECDEDGEAVVGTDGRIDLPDGWIWRQGSCNWGSGKLMHPECVECTRFNDNPLGGDA